MKKLLFLLLFLSSQIFGASRYWIGGGSNSNWNSSPITNWAATSGGIVPVAVPTSADDVFFDGAGVGGNTSVTKTTSSTILSLTFSAGYTATVTINTGVILTVAGAFTDNTAHSWTVNGTGSMTISAGSTITSGGKTFPGNVTISGTTQTYTLSGDWIISGTLTLTGVGSKVINATTSETLSCAGLTNNSVSTSGTAKIILTGGTWQGSQALQNNVDVAGNVTLGATLTYNTGTLTYISGTVTTTGNTLTIAASTTLNTAGISWNNIAITASSTITINSLLTVNGTLSCTNTTITFAGTSGFSCATFNNTNTGAATVTLVNGVTYTITTAFNCALSRSGSTVTFTSNHASNKAILTLNQGATCNVLANFTRIDASAGRTIWTFNGTVTTCLNVNVFNDLKTVAKNFAQ